MKISILMQSNMHYRRVQGLVGETSFSIVLPKAYATKLGITKGDFVKVYSDDDRIVISKARE